MAKNFSQKILSSRYRDKSDLSRRSYFNDRIQVNTFRVFFSTAFETNENHFIRLLSFSTFRETTKRKKKKRNVNATCTWNCVEILARTVTYSPNKATRKNLPSSNSSVEASVIYFLTGRQGTSFVAPLFVYEPGDKSGEQSNASKLD